jgi:hypothetical protein
MSDSTSTSVSGGGGSGVVCNLSDVPVATCQACAVQNCCGEIEACNGAGCGAYRTCLSGCKDPKCESACGTNAPAAPGAYDALGACALEHCPVECATLTVRPTGNLELYPTPSAPCRSCASPACSAVDAACFLEAGCHAYFGCVKQCNGLPECYDSCKKGIDLHALDLAEALLSCVSQSCRQVCNANLPCSGEGASLQCAAVIENQCCLEATACSGGACVDYLDCTSSCAAKPECLDTCASKHAVGVPLAAAYSNCLELCSGE